MFKTVMNSGIAQNVADDHDSSLSLKPDSHLSKKVVLFASLKPFLN